MNDRDLPETGSEEIDTGAEQHKKARRRLMMTLAAGGGAFAAANVLPKEWTRPIVNSIVVPAHAQASLAVGTFTTQSLESSIFDYLVQPLHAVVVPIGSVVVGNVAFDAAWNVGEDGYFLCGQGAVGGSVFFDIEGKGGRSGNSLQDFNMGVTGGTLAIIDQTVSPGGIEFTATYQALQTEASALPGGGCLSNVTTSLRMSSPYPDADRT